MAMSNESNHMEPGSRVVINIGGRSEDGRYWETNKLEARGTYIGPHSNGHLLVKIDGQNVEQIADCWRVQHLPVLDRIVEAVGED